MHGSTIWLMFCFWGWGSRAACPKYNIRMLYIIECMYVYIYKYHYNIFIYVCIRYSRSIIFAHVTNSSCRTRNAPNRTNSNILSIRTIFPSRIRILTYSGSLLCGLDTVTASDRCCCCCVAAAFMLMFTSLLRMLFVLQSAHPFDFPCIMCCVIWLLLWFYYVMLTPERR